MTSGHSGENSPVIVVLIKDLFFSVKVKNELSSLGYAPTIVKQEPELLTAIESSKPVLVLVDLNAGLDWDALAGILDPQGKVPSPPILAFGPHKDVDARREAQSAGVTRVVTNQQMHKNLREYVERYAVRAAN